MIFLLYSFGFFLAVPYIETLGSNEQHHLLLVCFDLGPLATGNFNKLVQEYLVVSVDL